MACDNPPFLSVSASESESGRELLVYRGWAAVITVDRMVVVGKGMAAGWKGRSSFHIS